MSKSCSSGYPKQSVYVEGEKSITALRHRKSPHHRLRAGIGGAGKKHPRGLAGGCSLPRAHFPVPQEEETSTQYHQVLWAF